MSQTLVNAPQQQTQKPSARRVSQPHDRDEREAERAAEVVARGGSVAGWSLSSLPTSPPAAAQESPVHRCTGRGGCLCDSCAGRVNTVLGEQGSPLDAGTRSFMEKGFGYDFSRVRLHADSRAGSSARALGARAYTVGEHVVSAEGAPTVASEPERRLLAHELAHVVQDRSSPEPATVHRQAAPAAAAPAAPARPQREERLGIGRGGGRIDAELDRSVGWLTAKVKVLFNFVNNPKPWPSPARQTAWRDSFIRTVFQRWSFKHFLVPEQVCPGEPQQVAVRLQVIPVTANPHFTMNVGFTDTFQQSSVGGRTATMDVLDVERRSDQPQVPAEHEFGHMLGLPHIHCDSNDKQCYGVTREERADVMGKGSFVSPHDYEPFAELMPYFTGCNWRVRQASFIPTSRGPLIGGFLGGLLGGVGGALLGSLLGPIGAIVGGVLGLAGGAALGAHLGTPDIPS
ncbi:MAG TPA: DUF4157 domain-containing protein [Gaiellaceae bacterium]